ncbi:MAG TPA: primosomal protein [Caulobacteraceae bacterium]|nr:primosomal protein [Caulobacteraceae bacterium]
MPEPREPDDVEGQDLAEVFDEENITPDGRDIATSDMQRDVYDATTAAEDADIDDVLAPEADFDPDAMDEVEYEEIVMADEDLDEPRSFRADDADRVRQGDAQPADLESELLADDDIEALGYDDERRPPDHDPHVEAQLDHGLEETFPASDPVSINPGAD